MAYYTSFSGKVPIIEDDIERKAPSLVYPSQYGRGFDPQQMIDQPVEMEAMPSEIELIPDSQVDAEIEEQERLKSSLEHIRMKEGPNGGHIPSLDQNGQGYCWAYSVTGTVMMIRALAGKPYKRLSAHAIGCLVKNYRDQGGWCGLSAEKIREMGVPTTDTWIEKSMSSKNDTAAMRADAAQNKIVSDFVDLNKRVYDQNLTMSQIRTCLLRNIPVALDFNWWGHSVLGLRWVKVSAGQYGILILNSWTDQWGRLGMSVLTGSKMIPMGAVATRATFGEVAKKTENTPTVAV